LLFNFIQSQKEGLGINLFLLHDNMAKFIISVELQNANEADYTRLTREFEKASFKRERNACKSEAYISEKSVFSKTCDITLQEINSEVSEAAAKTGKQYSFFVIKNKQNSTINQ
jgi:hypothetical protein